MTWQEASQLIDCRMEKSALHTSAIFSALKSFLWKGITPIKEGKVNDTRKRVKACRLYIDMWNKILTFLFPQIQIRKKIHLAFMF